MGLFLDDEEYQEELNYWSKQFTLNCPECNGTTTIKNVNGGYNLCNCAKKATIFANLVSNGVPKSFITWKWNNCEKASGIILSQCQNYVKNFNNNFKNCHGMYIFGTQGVGKTTLATVMAKYIGTMINPDTNKRYNVAFAPYETLVYWNVNTYNQILQQKLETFVRKSQLAIIDNVGAEPGNQQNNTRLLDKILRERRGRGYPTIITSNYTVDEIKQHYSDTVKDFITQSFNEIPVIGKNMRAKDNINDLINGLDDLGVE